MKLREYQVEAVNELWKALFTENKILCVLPTGSGKSEIIFEIIRKSIQVKPDIKILFALKRITLLKQIHQRASEFNPSTYSGSVGEKDLSKNIVIGSIQSLIKAELPAFNILFLDEAHNLNIKDPKSAYSKLIETLQVKNPKTKFIGFTATPYRNNGFIYGENEFFGKIHYQKNIEFFIENKFLCNIILKGSDKKKSFEIEKLKTVAGDFDQKQVNEQAANLNKMHDQVSDALSRLSGRKKILWFCANIEHAISVRNSLSQKCENAALIHSKMQQDEQECNIYWFEKSDFRHLVFVSIVSEGWDFPPVDALVILRPTKSPNLYVQTVGRVLRPYPGKINALVLDYGRVIECLGPISSPYLEFLKQQKDNELGLKLCKNCLSFNEMHNTECVDCGHPFTTQRRKIPELSKKPEDGSHFDILSGRSKEQKYTLPCVSTHVNNDYISKSSGRKMIRITYSLDTGILFFLPDKVFHYIVPNSFKHHAFLENNDFMLMLDNKKNPQKVTIVKKDQYWNIDSIEW